MNQTRLQEIIQSFENKKLLVIGDLILDEFIWGRVSRISPEAPVPVVEVQSESYYPGGAANVARNLREFANHIWVMGLLGTGLHADQLKKLLTEQKINIDCLIQDSNYQTIVKTRIIARHQQVVRVDREKKAGLTEAQKDLALKHLSLLLPQIDAIILEDYGKGLLQQELVDEILKRAKLAGKIITVDPHPNSNLSWNGITAITPNRTEAFVAAGQTWCEPIYPVEQDVSLFKVGNLLLKKWGTENLLITLGEQGMMLFRHDLAPFHIPTRAREVFDVSGAGDTAIALFSLALCSGATPTEASEISNYASGIVVGKLGTAIVSREELLRSFDHEF